ncbi:hypothetical protein BU17DRAFT_72325 [Hysterangium stoloniferum]|nr:hypothetical protein BU17DRAFT_72325 [Hysterangium stoloniferum]
MLCLDPSHASATPTAMDSEGINNHGYGHGWNAGSQIRDQSTEGANRLIISDSPVLMELVVQAANRNGPNEFRVIATWKTWSIIDQLHNITGSTLGLNGYYDEA